MTTISPSRAPEDSYVLVVDDDTGIRETIKELLEFEGYPARTAEDGLSALRLLEPREGRGVPCLILLDLMMPVMDGWEFLKVIKTQRDSALSDVPVVVVSALDEAGELPGRFGCDVMRKPVDIDRLLEVVERHCPRRA